MFLKRKSAGVAPEDETPAPVEQKSKKPEKLGWFEKRDRRRRRRILFEEVLGWILVPAFVYLIYLGVQALGGIPKEAIDFGNELIGLALKSI